MRIFIKLALRNILKNRFSFLIVFASLIVGFTVTLFIGIYLYNEISYDKFHKKDNIYRVSFSGSFPSGKTNYAFSWAPLGPKMNEYFPEIIDYVRMYRLPFSQKVEYNDFSFLEDDLFYVDHNFFNFFSFDLIKGNPETVLNRPNCAVVSEKIAKKYFGDDDPIGKIIEADNREFEITGIVKRPPINSHIKFNILFSIATMDGDRIGPDKALESWRRVNFYTYLQLLNDKSIHSVQLAKQNFIKNELSHFKKDLNVDIDLLFYNIDEIHLNSHLDRELEPNNTRSNLWIVSFIGFFVFIISCVNFILITTNINLTRFKEVFVKRVVGQNKASLIRTYLIEILLVCFVSFILALFLFNFLLPEYNLITKSEFSIAYLMQWKIIVGIILILLFVGIVPGYLSGKTLLSFKLTSTQNKPFTLKIFNHKLNLTIQFCIAFTLIICSLVFNKQLSFIQNHDLGYDKSNLLLINVSDRNARKNVENVFREFTKSAKVKSISVSSNHFANEPATFAVSTVNKGERNEIQTNYNNVDYSFVDNYGLNIIDGRSFSTEYPTDSFGVVVNQTFCNEMNLADPINEKIFFLDKEYHIIGVVKDFVFSSFRERIEPYVMFLKRSSNFNRYLSIKLDDSINRETIESLALIWSKVFPENVMDYEVFENSLKYRYQNDLLLVKLLKYLNWIVFIIAISGLLGQNFLYLRIKKKEIAIRKVLGANFQNLLYVLIKGYFIVLILAWAISSLISYFIISNWINNFVLKFENQFLYYIVPILVSIILLLTMTSIRAIKALKESPNIALKDE